MMSKTIISLSSNEQLMILEFWAHGTDILNQFTEEQIAAVPGLREAIEAVRTLPEQIGWGGTVDESDQD